MVGDPEVLNWSRNRMKIFVANFDRKTGERELEALFSEYGRVQEATIAFNWKTEEQEEWGFVEIQDNDDAERAIRKLNGCWWNGQRLKVSKARSRG
jgi:RNA recognition motif-containing protein